MNRIILIGNGFDLAHNLETSYKQFIDNFWKETIADFKNPEKRGNDIFENIMLSINIILPIHTQYLQEIQSYNDFTAYFEKEKEFSMRYATDKKKMSISFKNRFLKIITEKTSLQNWVDIEEEYYQQIKDIVQNKSQYYSDEGEKTAIAKLNDDFCQIKNSLKTYLIEKTTEGIGGNAIEFVDDKISKNIYSEFELGDFTKEGAEQIVNETIKKAQYCLENKDELEKSDYIDFNTQRLLKLKKEDADIKEIILDHNQRKSYFHFIPDSILFLNFNYSNTENLYAKQKYEVPGYRYGVLTELEINKETIHIHGELKNSTSPIIFGYGDESDEVHKEIEKKGGDYLNNVKTINYLKTPNYKNLLKFIESGMYQVFIMGHSCGFSDKTLLNTLFEHENCVSIKPFFYKWKDENGIEHDDYEDKIKNIYRVFTDKTLMREKVVNKEYCKQLS